MANTNAPFGLKQLGLNGSSVAPTMGQFTQRNGILSTDTTKIYFGDPVQMQASGQILQWAAGTAVSQLWGVFIGCRYYSTSQNNILYSPYWPGGDAASGSVDAFLIPGINSPAGQYVIQTDDTGITTADIGTNCDVAASYTGSTFGGCFSGMYLNVPGTTTATLPFRIVDLWANRAPSGSPGTAAGAYNWAVVALNVSGSTGI